MKAPIDAALGCACIDVCLARKKRYTFFGVSILILQGSNNYHIHLEIVQLPFCFCLDQQGANGQSFLPIHRM